MTTNYRFSTPSKAIPGALIQHDFFGTPRAEVARMLRHFRKFGPVAVSILPKAGA